MGGWGLVDCGLRLVVEVYATWGLDPAGWWETGPRGDKFEGLSRVVSLLGETH